MDAIAGVKSIVIRQSLAGSEADLVRAIDLPPPYAVVTDQNTYEVLGRRIEEALGSVVPIRLEGRPIADDRLAAQIMRAGIKAASYIAVGAGTISDLAKLAAARQGKPHAVFATAPSTSGYAAATASIMVGGMRTSLPAAPPLGVFGDLETLAAAPKRLIATGLGIAICRSTAQADWLLRHRLLDANDSSLPQALLAEDELFAEPERLMRGDVAAIALLMRVLLHSSVALSANNSGAHRISDCIDNMPPPGWRPALHGEQIAVATLAMARLQEALLAGPPPVIDDEALSAKLAAIWPALSGELAKIATPASRMADILARAGAPTSYRDLDLDRHYFATAIWQARALRPCYTFLDLAAASRQLVPERLLDP